MKSLAFLLLISSILAEKLVIPQVEQAIKAQNALFTNYVTYKGPNVTELNRAQQQQAAFRFNNFAAKPQAAPDYWYEKIAHQGVAAFNSQSGYKVYRNVMSYGAKG